MFHNGINLNISLLLGVGIVVIGYGNHRPAKVAQDPARRTHQFGWTTVLGRQPYDGVRLHLPIERTRRNNTAATGGPGYVVFLLL